MIHNLVLAAVPGTLAGCASPYADSDADVSVAGAVPRPSRIGRPSSLCRPRAKAATRGGSRPHGPTRRKSGAWLARA
jgi:hypothetical protein